MLKHLLTALVLALLAALQCQAQERFGTVYRVQGVVTASDARSAAVRDLHEGDVLRVGEVVRAGTQAEAVLQMDDGGVIAVRPGTVFLIDQFVAGGRRDDVLSLRILRGGLRLVTGWIGAVDKRNYRIVTPRATVGIRGTDHEPYVVTSDMALDMKQPEGTYDKVNTGGTTLVSDAGDVEVSPGQAGYAPVPGSVTRMRALMTALMPRILDRVPDFYRGGAYDDLLAELAQRSREDAERRGLAPGPAAMADAPAKPVAAAAPTPATPSPAAAAQPCDRIARAWLAELDDALLRRDAPAFVGKFSADANIEAVVRTGDGQEALLEFSREEMAASTLDSLADLQSFSTFRPTVVVQDKSLAGTGACTRLHVESITVESGVRSGRAYRVESLESFELESREGIWIATGARTTQR